MSRVFHRSFGGPTHVSFDTSSERIQYSTNIYDAKFLCHRQVEIDITEEEWSQLVKYGIEAGYEDPRT